MALPVELRRDEFAGEVWDYRGGQHVLCVCPTGGGKSRLLWQLIGESMRQNPGLGVVSYMPKHTDPTTAENAARLGLQETPVWPPAPKLFAGRPRGYVLWPQHPHGDGIDTEGRRAAVGRQLKKGMEAQYWKGNSVNFIDDAHSAAAMMDLNPLIEEMLVNGRASKCGVWLATQKPSGTLASGGLTSYAYNSASHLFLGLDYDPRNLARMSEIGGVDPKQIAGWIRGLRTWRFGDSNVTEWLYVDKSGPFYARILPW